jgi:hypothetical protein
MLSKEELDKLIAEYGVLALGRMVLVRVSTKGDFAAENEKLFLPPESLSKQLPEGYVLSVGPTSNFGISVGDYVHFEPNGVRRLHRYAETRLVLLLDEHIYAKESV